MKKHPLYLVACSLMLAMIITERTEAQPYSSWFFDKKIHYSQIPEDIFADIIASRYGDRMSDWNLGAYESLQTADYFREPDEQMISRGEHVVEVRSGNDIYTWPIACCSKDKKIAFYARGVDPNNIFSTTVIHGMHVATAVAYMNMLKIGEASTPISSCFEEPSFNNNVLVFPWQYLRFGSDNEYVLFSYSLSHPEVASVVYTQPKYVFMAGQLMEVNSGVNYDVRMKEVPGLSLFDTKTMQAVPNTTIHLKGIKKPKIKHSKKQFYYFDVSDYYCAFPQDFYNGYELVKNSRISVMSQNGTPIYILSVKPSQLIVESQIIPADGDVVCDLQETSKYICYCGTNKKHGYIGYENPVLVVLDRNSKKAVARYYGNNGKVRKDRVFNKMYVLDDDHLLIMYNDYHYRSEDYYGKRLNRKYEIVSLSSLVSNGGVTVK